MRSRLAPRGCVVSRAGRSTFRPASRLGRRSCAATCRSRGRCARRSTGSRRPTTSSTRWGQVAPSRRLIVRRLRRSARAARAVGVRRHRLPRRPRAGRPLRSTSPRGRRSARILRESGVPTIEFRASIVIGSGSALFEMLRALVERLPVMVTPRRVGDAHTPIAIEDVLVVTSSAALDQQTGRKRGVRDRRRRRLLGTLDLMHEYADRRGLDRHMIPVPVLTPRLSSLWLHLVTPVYAGIGRELVDSLRNETVVNDPRALEVFPVRPWTMLPRRSRRALANEDNEIAETRWSDEVLAPSPGYGGTRYGSRLVDSRSVEVPRSPRAAFAPIQRIGGETGWYVGHELWELRGGLGRACRRARPATRAPRRSRHPGRRHDRLLARRGLRARPAAAARSRDESARARLASVRGRTRRYQAVRRSRQTAIFDPSGIAGLAYWYALWPIHDYIFGGMLKRIRRRLGLHLSAAPALPSGDQTGSRSRRIRTATPPRWARPRTAGPGNSG